MAKLKKNRIIWLCVMIAALLVIVLGLLGIVIFSRKIQYAPLIISVILSTGGLVFLPFAVNNFVKLKKSEQ